VTGFTGMRNGRPFITARAVDVAIDGVPPAATPDVTGVVTALHPDAQGNQNIVMLTIADADAVALGSDLIVHRGNQFIVKVHVERVLNTMVVCRVLPDTWNTGKLAITLGDQVGNRR
jgi:hypothetical protein